MIPTSVSSQIINKCVTNFNTKCSESPNSSPNTLGNLYDNDSHLCVLSTNDASALCLQPTLCVWELLLLFSVIIFCVW